MSNEHIIQLPDSTKQLLLLFHGVGGVPADMVALGQHLAAAFPEAAIISISGRHSSDFGRGYQWFSVSGITEHNRGERITDAMPDFVQTVHTWQHRTNVTPQDTTLLGFSQGAIMALESSQLDVPLSAHVVSLSGRFAHLPQHAPSTMSWHFIHGKADNVIDYRHAVDAAHTLSELGGHVTTDIIDQLGHGVTTEVADNVVKRLQAGAHQ